MTHSEQHMGAREHDVVFTNPVVIDNDQDVQQQLMPNNGNSYLNRDLHTVLGLPYGKSLLIRRAWETKNSASPTASNIKNGKIPGPFSGAEHLFKAKAIPDPRKEGFWTVKVWPVYSWLGF